MKKSAEKRFSKHGAEREISGLTAQQVTGYGKTGLSLKAVTVNSDCLFAVRTLPHRPYLLPLPEIFIFN